jgi:hypothetical protein
MLLSKSWRRVTKDDWNTKHKELKDELKLPSAHDNLVNGSKAWIAENRSSRRGTTPSNERPAGLKSQVRNH